MIFIKHTFLQHLFLLLFCTLLGWRRGGGGDHYKNIFYNFYFAVSGTLILMPSLFCSQDKNLQYKKQKKICVLYNATFIWEYKSIKTYNVVVVTKETEITENGFPDGRLVGRTECIFKFILFRVYIILFYYIILPAVPLKRFGSADCVQRDR